MGSNPPIRAIPPQVAEPNRHIAHFLSATRPYALEHARKGMSYFVRSRTGGDHLREEDWNLDYDPARAPSVLPSAAALLARADTELRRLADTELRDRARKVFAAKLALDAAAANAVRPHAKRLADARCAPYPSRRKDGAGSTAHHMLDQQHHHHHHNGGGGAARLHEAREGGASDALGIANGVAAGGASAMGLRSSLLHVTTTPAFPSATRPTSAPKKLVLDNSPLAELALAERFKSNAVQGAAGRLTVQMPRGGIFARGVASQPVKVAAALAQVKAQAQHASPTAPGAASFDELRFLGLSLNGPPIMDGPTYIAPAATPSSNVTPAAQRPAPQPSQPAPVIRFDLATLLTAGRGDQPQPAQPFIPGHSVPTNWHWALQDATAPTPQPPLNQWPTVGMPTTVDAATTTAMLAAKMASAAANRAANTNANVTATATRTGNWANIAINESPLASPRTGADEAAGTRTLHQPPHDFIAALSDWVDSNFTGNPPQNPNCGHHLDDRVGSADPPHRYDLTSTLDRVNWSRPLSAPPEQQPQDAPDVDMVGESSPSGGAPVIMPLEPEYDPPSFAHTAVDDTLFPERSSLQPTSPAYLAPSPASHEWAVPTAGPTPWPSNDDSWLYNYGLGVDLDPTVGVNAKPTYPAPYSYGYQPKADPATHMITNPSPNPQHSHSHSFFDMPIDTIDTIDDPNDALRMY